MVGPDIGDHMVRRVHTELAQVVQLPGLAGLYADTRIGVGGTVMGLVAGVLTALVPCSRPLVLVLGPFPVPAFYPLELLFTGRDTLLLFGGLVVLGSSYRSFFLSISLICRILCKWASRSSSGTFSSRLSIEALALTGAESMAWV
jgi:hypothetical protein